MIFIVLAGLSIIQFGSFAIIGLPILLLYRVLLGAVEGPMIPIGMSHISKIFPAELRGFAVSVFIAGASIGGVVCAPILVGLIEKLGWKWTLCHWGLSVWFYE